MTRLVGESFVIGDEVTVTILGTKDNQVRIGITKPDNIEVHREEIWYKIKNYESIK